MARKHHAKHSKNTILASASAHSFSKLSVGAASAVVGASLALSAAPALAQTESTPAAAQQSASADNAANPVKPGTVKQESVKSVENKQVGGVILVKPLRQTQRFRKLLLQKVLIVQLPLHQLQKLTVR